MPAWSKTPSIGQLGCDFGPIERFIAPICCQARADQTNAQLTNPALDRLRRLQLAWSQSQAPCIRQFHGWWTTKRRTPF